MNIALTHLKDAEGHPPVERQVQITSLDGSCGCSFRLNLAISHKKGVVFMPIYEYKCLSCGVKIEKIQKFSDPLLENCSECGGKLEKLLSLSGFQFKGSGWYVTDYVRKSNGKSASESTEKSADTSKPAECGSSGCSVAGCASTN